VVVVELSRDQPVPWRAIYGALLAALSVAGGVLLVLALHRILTWVGIAAFFAVALSPLVTLLEDRLHVRRTVATAIVVVLTLVVLAGIVATFVVPLVHEGSQLADDLPRYVRDARNGRGPFGGLIRRFDLDQRLQADSGSFQQYLDELGANSLRIARGVGTAVAGTVTVIVLTVLMLVEGPDIVSTTTNLIPERHRDRTRRVAADCARAVTGYVAGNLVISVIAGLATLAFLLITDVPFAAVLSLWVGVADLIPLVGATLGAAVVVLVAGVHSLQVGIAALVLYVVYQQFENHVLQVVIMSRTVRLNPLAVLLSVLVGVELLGLVGALVAVPVAGVAQVIVRDVWDERRNRPKAEPSIGEDEVP
jgi:predicted PurR-regulated permease PerM